MLRLQCDPKVCVHVVQSLFLAYGTIAKAIHMMLLLLMTSCQLKMSLLLMVLQQALGLVHNQACDAA